MYRGLVLLEKKKKEKRQRCPPGRETGRGYPRMCPLVCPPGGCCTRVEGRSCFTSFGVSKRMEGCGMYPPGIRPLANTLSEDDEEDFTGVLTTTSDSKRAEGWGMVPP